MRVIVTGGAGFIGSHIVDVLTERGHTPIVLDNFSTGTRDNLSQDVQVIESDVSDPSIVDTIVNAEPDAIIHAAAQASVPRSMLDPDHDRTVNLLGTAHVIEAAKQAGNRRIVFLSTGGGIYGETETPATEETLPKPKSFYSLHKYAAEKYIELSGLPYAIARLANVYGPRQQSHLEGGVVAIFAERLARRKPITIYGSGEQKRDFIHVSDVSEAIVAMLEAPSNRLWNVGTGSTTTINALLAHMELVIAPASKIERREPRVGDVQNSCLSVQKASQELGWRPHISLEKGIMTLKSTLV